jgi:SAM-dependent methyltransferase
VTSKRFSIPGPIAKEKGLGIQRDGLERLRAHLYATEANAAPSVGFEGPSALFQTVDALLWKEAGHRLHGRTGLDGVVHELRRSARLLQVLSAVKFALDDWIEFQTHVPLSQRFEHGLNELLTDCESPFRMAAGMWIQSHDAEAEELLRVLLQGADETAACRQGDIQVEMVSSSAQMLLGPGKVLVDYGCGLGRVGESLASAELFGQAQYIAVDEPIAPAMEALTARLTGARTIIRSAFLDAPVAADLIMVVNVLHHIPFADLGRQFDTLLRSLKLGGVIVLHEMGAHHEPEKENVPWLASDVVRLLQLDGVTVSPRTTMSSKKKIPLAHVVVSGTGAGPFSAAIHENAWVVWRAMKAQVLHEIDGLYRAKDPANAVTLNRLLYLNANLDLNRPDDRPLF